jgi:hypothetical protein
MPLLVQKISWAAKNVTQVFFAYLAKLNHRVVASKPAQVVTGAIKLMRDLQYLVCGPVLLVIMLQTLPERKQETRLALYVKLDISVKVEIVTKHFVSLDIIALQGQREQLNSLALLALISHYMVSQVHQVAKTV